MARYTNTVPQGIAGTGNAVIYGDNPVAAQFGNQLAQLRQNQYRDELLKQQQAEMLAKQMRDNQLAASEGRLWAQDIGKLEQDHIQKGIELQQKGINPYGTSPQALQYQKERRDVQAQQGYRKATESRFNELNKLVSANPNKYDPQSIKELHDFFANTKLSDAYSGNAALPELRDRYDVNESLKDLKAATAQVVKPNGEVITDVTHLDRPKTEDIIIGKLANGSPQDQAKLMEITSGVAPSEIRQIGDTIEENAVKLRKLYAENAPLRDQIARDAGIRPFSDEYDKYIQEHARELTRIKRTFNDAIMPMVDRISSGLKEVDKTTLIPVKRDPLADYAWKRQYAIVHPLPRRGGDAGVQQGDFNVVPKVFLTEPIERKDPKTGKPVADPKSITPSLEFSHYTTVNPISFDAPQSESVYDIGEKNNKGIPAGTFNITGIGYTNFYGVPQYKVTVSDPKDYNKEYAFNLEQVPTGIRARKDFKAALSAVQAAKGGGSATTAQAPSKGVTDSEFEELLKRAKALKGK